MSLSDLTRSYTTFPPASSSTTVPSRAPSGQSTSSTYTYKPRTTSTSYSYASEGPSNIPGRSIAVGSTALPSAAASSSASSSGDGVDGLALGLGLGLGLGLLLTLLTVGFIFYQRKSQRANFDRRAEVIRSKMAAADEVDQNKMRSTEL